MSSKSSGPNPKRSRPAYEFVRRTEELDSSTMRLPCARSLAMHSRAPS